MIKHSFLFLFCCITALAQQYKLEAVTTAPADVPPAFASLLDAKGYRVSGPSGPWCEIWFRKSIPTGAKAADSAVSFSIAQGTLLGVIRFPSRGTDRRDQTLKPGLYTLRYSNYPVDGAHQGVAPQRDFALLTPIANDKDPAAMPSFEKLVEQSKTSGTAHAAVFSLQLPTGSNFPALSLEGEHDWLLSVKAGDLSFGIIVVGKAEG